MLASAIVVSAPQQSIVGIGTVVPAPRQFNRKVQSAHVNRKCSAEGRLKGLGIVENPCRIYRGSWSLPIGQALPLNMRTFGVVGLADRFSVSITTNGRGPGAVEETCWFHRTACLVRGKERESDTWGSKPVRDVQHNTQGRVNNQLGFKSIEC